MDYIAYLIIGLGIGFASWLVIKKRELNQAEKRRLSLTIIGLLVILGYIIFIIAR